MIYIYHANPVLKLTKLCDSNFIVCMLYKQVYWHSLLVSFVIHFLVWYILHIFHCTWCIIVIINKRIWIYDFFPSPRLMALYKYALIDWLIWIYIMYRDTKLLTVADLARSATNFADQPACTADSLRYISHVSQLSWCTSIIQWE